MTYYTRGECAERHVFNTSLCYSKRKRKKRLSSSKNDLFQHYEAAETGQHCQWCAKPLLIDQICHFEPQLILSLRIRLSERREGKRERQVMPPLVLLIKFISYFG